MGRKRRPMSEKLPAKLIAIRAAFYVSQPQMAHALSVEVGTFKITDARISEFEHNVREPNMVVLLAYARLAGLQLEYIVDDKIDLTRLCNALAKKAKFIEKQKRRLIKPTTSHLPRFRST